MICCVFPRIWGVIDLVHQSRNKAREKRPSIYQVTGRFGEKVSETLISSGEAGETYLETTDILLPEVDLEGYAYYIRLFLPAQQRSGDKWSTR